jgi:hypothetical protein
MRRHLFVCVFEMLSISETFIIVNGPAASPYHHLWLLAWYTTSYLVLTYLVLKLSLCLLIAYKHNTLHHHPRTIAFDSVSLLFNLFSLTTHHSPLAFKKSSSGLLSRSTPQSFILFFLVVPFCCCYATENYSTCFYLESSQLQFVA